MAHLQHSLYDGDIIIQQTLPARLANCHLLLRNGVAATIRREYIHQVDYRLLYYVVHAIGNTSGPLIIRCITHLTPCGRHSIIDQPHIGHSDRVHLVVVHAMPANDITINANVEHIQLDCNHTHPSVRSLALTSNTAERQ